MSEMRRWNEPVEAHWHNDAACHTRGWQPNIWALFEPVGLDEDKEDAWDRAREAIENYCGVCLVKDFCRREGERHLYEGVWGGEFRERRGVIDTDTGMVLRPDVGFEPVAGAEPEPCSPPSESEPVELPPLEDEWTVRYETVTTKAGVEQFVLLSV